ncbi:hypothetical protein [Kocuria rosea]|uniref:MmyB family transcriptional regulator n=1 Tax=Kocuria rosea TaxID=1275 RepID=UPI001F101025|nr:hypothetical protein [Kocuria rosea]
MDNRTEVRDFLVSRRAELTPAQAGLPAGGNRRASRQASSRPGLQRALEAITGGVAFVRNQHQDLLATNPLGRAFYAPLLGDGGRTPNPARFQFLDPASREFYPDREVFAGMCVAIMRAEAGREPHAPVPYASWASSGARAAPCCRRSPVAEGSPSARTCRAERRNATRRVC